MLSLEASSVLSVLLYSVSASTIDRGALCVWYTCLDYSAGSLGSLQVGKTGNNLSFDSSKLLGKFIFAVTKNTVYRLPVI
jgi:hypothetical protein